jgi:DNA-binding PadR family transcriptional regulator
MKVYVKMLEKRILEKHVKTFLDIIIIAMLNSKPAYGYKIIGVLHKEFEVLLSPGSLYPLLRKLEDKKLIESSFNGGKLVYTITPKGKKQLQNAFLAYKDAIQRMESFIARGGE